MHQRHPLWVSWKNSPIFRQRKYITAFSRALAHIHICFIIYGVLQKSECYTRKYNFIYFIAIDNVSNVSHNISHFRSLNQDKRIRKISFWKIEVASEKSCKLLASFLHILKESNIVRIVIPKEHISITFIVLPLLSGKLDRCFLKWFFCVKLSLSYCHLNKIVHFWHFQ